jgi:SAM-dependent methyltransferase
MARIAPLYHDLSFNSPLSDDRAARMIRTLGRLDRALVVDIGCGWAEMLLRVLAAAPSATGVGIDADEDVIARGRANAERRGMADRVDLRVTDAVAWTGEPADVAICIGSSHALGGTAEALSALRDMVKPGGRVLLGEGIWSRPPTEAATAALGGTPDEYVTLAELVDLAVAQSWRPLDIGEASAQEWDEFESGYALAVERWLLEHPDDPQFAAVQAGADTHRARWLHGYRGILGLAYLTLVRPARGPGTR